MPANFGSTKPGVAYDPQTTSGWNKRNYNWQFSAGVQHQRDDAELPTQLRCIGCAPALEESAAFYCDVRGHREIRSPPADMPTAGDTILIQLQMR